MQLEIHPGIRTSTSVHWRSLLIVLVSLLAVTAIQLLVQAGCEILKSTVPIPSWSAMAATTLLIPMTAHNYTLWPRTILMLMHFLHGGKQIYIVAYKSSESPAGSHSCPRIPGGLLIGLKATPVRAVHAWLSTQISDPTLIYRV